MATQKSVFGFAKVDVVTKAVLKERIKFLESGLDSGKWDRNPDKRFNAMKTAAYYRWQLAHFDEAVRPAERKAKAKAKKKSTAKRVKSDKRAAA